MENDFSGIKPGDRVWVSLGYKVTTLKTVLRTTADQVVLDWWGDGKCLVRYRRIGGQEIGSKNRRLIGKAIPRECELWDAMRADEERNKQEIWKNAQELQIRKRDLLAEFKGIEGVLVEEESWGTEEEQAGKWTVQLHYMSTEQVKELARFIRTHARGRAA